MDGYGTKCRRNIAENFNRLNRAAGRTNVTDDRQTTDGRATAYSEREREFAKNDTRIHSNGTCTLLSDKNKNLRRR